MVYCGCFKSFYTRRGFGFIICEETASRFGRDVYLSKDETMTLVADGVEAPLSADAADKPGNEKSKFRSIQEGDVLLFQVYLSIEGFPQAVQVRKMCRLRGVVYRSPSSEADAIIIVTAEDDTAAEDTTSQQLAGVEVRLRQVECGLNSYVACQQFGLRLHCTGHLP